MEGENVYKLLELNKIYNEDCIKENGMCLIPDKSVDMILCDLPYGTTQNKWDSIIPLDKLWEQYKRIIKSNGAIILFAQIPFNIKLAQSNLYWLRYEWIWEKNQGTGFMNAKKMPLKIHENILVFYNKLPTYNPQMTKGEPYIQKRKGNIDTGENYGQVGIKQRTDTVNKGERYPTTIIKYKYDKNRIHPTQKPLDLCEYLINTYTNENETVLDNCMGSGTTAIACINTKRNYIGFETDEKYYQLSLERIKNHKIA